MNLKNSKEKFDVEIVIKDIKKTRLKVFPSGKISITVSEGTPQAWIDDFLESRKTWINKKLQLFKDTKEIELESDIKQGTATRILGRQLCVSIIESRSKKIEIQDTYLVIYTPCIENQEAINKQFDNWWKIASKKHFRTVIDKYYPILKRRKIEMPRLSIRKMKTLWGSCSNKEHSIMLNSYLFKAPVFCIEYVVLHEILHFIYPNHDLNFYKMLTANMPDWKERIKTLNYEVVQGF